MTGVELTQYFGGARIVINIATGIVTEIIITFASKIVIRIVTMYELLRPRSPFRACEFGIVTLLRPER